MNNKNNKLKRRLRTIIILSVIAVVIAGGAVGLYLYSQSQIVVDVFPMQAVSMSWNNNNPTPASISTDVTQRVYLTPSDTVEEILVEEGAEVQKGDTLISYDTTLLDLQVEIGGLNIAITKTRIANKEKELANFKKNYASLLDTAALAEAPPPAAPTASAPLEPSAAVSADEDPAPTPSVSPGITLGNENEIPVPYKHIDSDSKPYSGSGTSAQPFRYFMTSGATIDSKFIVDLAIKNRDESLYMVMETRKDNLFSGSVISWFHITIKPDGSFEYQLRLSPDLAPFEPPATDTVEPSDPSALPSEMPAEPTPEAPAETPTETPTESPTPTPTPTKTPTPAPTVPVYTKDEAQRLYAEMQKDLTNMKLDLRQQEITHKSTTRRLESGTVKSNISGRVVAVLDVETAMQTSQPVVIVSGGEGFFVTGTVSELDLDRVDVGQTVTVRSWAFEAEGEIVEVGIYPVVNDPYVSNSTNISFYPITVYVGPEYDLSNEYYAEIYPHFDDSASGLGALYVDRAFVMPAEGANPPYVYIADPENENRLKKVEVQTGQLLWGSFIEVREGLAGDENLAFPYDKNARDGVNTQAKESLYNYYY